jgi:hypothetical protein
MQRRVIEAVLANVLSAPLLALAFAHTELERWWRERPTSIAILLLVGVALSVAGAVMPRRLPLPTLGGVSQFGEVAIGAILGLLFAFVGGVVGWIAADVTLWVLLAWFFLAAFLLGSAQVVLPMYGRRDG